MYLVPYHSLGSDDLLKDVFPDVRVDGTEGVVQEVDVCLLVDCSRQTHPLLLTSAQVDPLTCVHTCVFSYIHSSIGRVCVCVYHCIGRLIPCHASGVGYTDDPSSVSCYKKACVVVRHPGKLSPAN